mmetsp:Transcript_12766/g.18638  ORF Transcript_12766/g.18638 Transcript_12766/m.18638 type:complete len:294 (+) Transcript_12766:1884-2765(+)
MSIVAYFNPNFWYQLRFFRPHKINGKWRFIKRDICLPYNVPPRIEQRMVHIKYDPPLMGRWYSWILSTGLFRRTAASFFDHVVFRIKQRGNCWNDYVGKHRRKIRYPVFAKNRDPYQWMYLGARNVRSRHWRTYGWQVPEQHGPGAGLGILPVHLDYPNKITRMTEDDWTDTGVSCYAGKMFPTLTIRKYFNELPRPTPFEYGMDYTKEQMFNHIAFGIDPGNLKIDELKNPSDPKLAEERREEKEIQEYLWPDVAAAFKPDYKLKWPFPDDNVYRPTYNRGFNRRYWSRAPY